MALTFQETFSMDSNIPTRRQFAVNLALAASGLAAVSALHAEARSMQQIPPTNPGDTRTALHQEVELAASVARIESALLDAKQFAAFTRLAATVDAHEGGAFSLFGGLIVGRNIEIVPGERVVQAWRPTHWDPGVYSVAKFAFKPSGSGTLVVLDHTGFPAGDFDHLSAGWHEHYWEPLKKFFA
jgi:activator of HSP90 ATPase